jgi:hypothetical protein
MAKEKLKLVVPPEGEFEPATILFGAVSGEGVDNYDGDGKEYKVAIQLDKKEAKWFRKQVLEFWEEYAPRGAGDKPANWETLLREDKEEDGKFVLYAKTNTEFNGQPKIIPIVNHKGAKLDPEQYGRIGKGSKGRIAVSVATYTQGKNNAKSGVSVFLDAVKLIKFVEPSSGIPFGEEEGEVEAEGGFGAEKSVEKEKKKKKKKKKKGDDD